MQPIQCEISVSVDPNGQIGDKWLNALTQILYNYNWALGGQIHLYTKSIVPNKLGGLGQFKEMTTAEWSGYYPGIEVVSNPPGHDADGNWQADAGSLIVWKLAVDATIPTTVFGVFVDDTVGGLVCWVVFPTPVILAEIGDEIIILPSAKIFE